MERGQNGTFPSKVDGSPTFNDLSVHHSHCIGNAARSKARATRRPCRQVPDTTEFLR
jgi:hypothetical protein